MCLSSGMPFLEALDISISTLTNASLKNQLQLCYQHVRKGERFGQTLQRVTNFPALATHMIVVGEESANIGGILTEIADVYAGEVQEGLHLLTTLLEPVLILVIGAVIGLVVIGMLLPIFDMNLAM